MSTVVTNEDAAGPGSSKKATAYNAAVRKRPFASAFPHGRRDDRLPGRSNLSSKTAKQGAGSSPSVDGHSGLQNLGRREAAEWDPYDIPDTDVQSKPKQTTRPDRRSDGRSDGLTPMPAYRRPQSAKSAKSPSRTTYGKMEQHSGLQPRAKNTVDSRRTGANAKKRQGGNHGTGKLGVSLLPRRPLDRDEGEGGTTQARSFLQPSAKVRSDRRDRPRLIDALADQADQADHSFTSDSGLEDSAFRSRDATPSRLIAEKLVATTPLSKLVAGSRSGAGLKSQSVKKTYGAQRSMLLVKETSFPGDDGGLSNLDSMFSRGRIPSPSKLGGGDFGLPADVSEDEAGAKGVRSIHELRQAGANNRFADEINDLVERIGTPGTQPSMRRNALLDFATKMCTKAFTRQFRNHSASPTLFDNTGNEEDMISGFALVSALLALLSTSVDQRLGSQLREGGIATLLRKLMAENSDVVAIASQRRRNVARSSQASTSSLKASVSKLPTWQRPQGAQGARSDLSPRRLALKFMDACCKPSPPSSFCLPGVEALAKELFSVLSDEQLLDEASQQPDSDMWLAASVLEAHSAQSSDADNVPRWTWNFLPVIVNLLSLCLANSLRLAGFGMTMLKLTINATHNNPLASEALAGSSLLERLAQASGSGFDLLKADLQSFVNSDGFNQLLLILGLMINFCEHGSRPESFLHGQALDKLIQIYLESYSSMREADSVAKTQINVAVGYLAVLLGYLCLSAPTRQRFDSLNRASGINCLVESIREVKQMLAKTDKEGNTAERLERLVDELEQVE